jgi:hypothetical protein
VILTRHTESKGERGVGIDYTFGAFFGAFAKEGSAAHEALEKMWLDGDGEIRLDREGVGASRHGNSWSGDFCYAIKQTPSIAFTSRSGGHSKAFALEDARPQLIIDTIAALGLNIEDFEPIGFYVYLDVW